MKFNIHFTKNGIDDFFNVEGNTVEEVETIVAEEKIKRGLDDLLNDMWSEQIK